MTLDRSAPELLRDQLAGLAEGLLFGVTGKGTFVAASRQD